MSSTRLDAAIEHIDAANGADPNRELVEGEETPKELIYGRRMSERLETFLPEASEALKIACRAQHLRRRSNLDDRAGFRPLPGS